MKHSPVFRPLRSSLPVATCATHQRIDHARSASSSPPIGKGCFRATPRNVNNLINFCRDYAQEHAKGKITLPTAAAALELLEIDAAGLDEMDKRVLRIMAENCKGGPVGLGTIAIAVGEESEPLEDTNRSSSRRATSSAPRWAACSRPKATTPSAWNPPPEATKARCSETPSPLSQAWEFPPTTSESRLSY